MHYYVTVVIKYIFYIFIGKYIHSSQSADKQMLLLQLRYFRSHYLARLEPTLPPIGYILLIKFHQRWNRGQMSHSVAKMEHSGHSVKKGRSSDAEYENNNVFIEN